MTLTALTSGNGVTEYAKAYKSGGFIHLSGGTMTTITLNAMTINAPSAETESGGLLYSSNTGGSSSTITMPTLSVKHAYAYTSGGMMYIGGGPLTLTLNTLTAKYLSTGPSGKGAGLYLANTGACAVNSNPATITSSVAGLDGGFIYRDGGDSFALDL